MGDETRVRVIRLGRREFLGAASSAFVVAQLGHGCDGAGTGADVIPGIQPNPIAEPLSPLTPNDLFYTISAAGLPDEGWDLNWQLSLLGLGEERRLTLAEIQGAAAHETFEHTLECIGNGPPGGNIGNAMWTGVRVASLLAGLGIELPDEIAWLSMRCGDGYSTYLPVEDIAAGLALVWEMNGEALPVAHGAPLRMLTPGRYGMKNPKWLLEIEWLVDKPQGFWESVGWSE
jgi:DMSO/TMAO reductase YedYZ molybdopterin-dependent catalytic subunit